jgi:hypothetical protein
VSKVRSVVEALHSPQVEAHGILAEIEHPRIGKVKALNSNALSAVTDAYQGPFPFSGTIRRVEVELIKYSPKEGKEAAEAAHRSEMTRQSKRPLSILAVSWIVRRRSSISTDIFHGYNTEHLHSRIDYVTPDQCHKALRERIVAHRKAKLNNQRLVRKEVNRSKQNPLTDDIITLILNPNQVMPCSVMNL